MSERKLPKPIDLAYLDAKDAFDVLVDRYNDLLMYVASKEGLHYNEYWDWVEYEVSDES